MATSDCVVTKTFKFSWQKNGCKVNFDIDVEIPLKLSFNDFLGMVCAQNNVPIFVKQGRYISSSSLCRFIILLLP